ncbi:glycine zipper family protein [Vibrio hippocampi]|uniref:Glycine-zipper-containing OmpA-like membrane domain-containing protein n=1 Tax=Vibrio hippocampi TaxID=654686 RepID=A0ABM8ZMT7_9VIBR|nr:glycine zipper family protein [Vibrio hippocampi]CAH0529536.1 hypothetical protein VHP8226_03290 [Vibrio hippocampi]
MQKLLVSTALFFSCFANATGGTVMDQQSKIVFSFKNVSHETAQGELNQCQGIAMGTHSQVASTSGSGVRGAAKGAAAGAAAGAISGGSGSDGAKIGAAVGLIGGRLAKRGEAAQSVQANEDMYATVLRNCMIDKHYVPYN